MGSLSKRGENSCKRTWRKRETVNRNTRQSQIRRSETSFIGDDASRSTLRFPLSEWKSQLKMGAGLAGVA